MRSHLRSKHRREFSLPPIRSSRLGGRHADSGADSPASAPNSLPRVPAPAPSPLSSTLHSRAKGGLAEAAAPHAPGTPTASFTATPAQSARAAAAAAGSEVAAPAGACLVWNVFGDVYCAQGARPYMEDRAVLLLDFRPAPASASSPMPEMVPQSCFAAVYDGHGGANAAQTASEAVHALLQADAAFWRAACAMVEEAPPPAQAELEELSSGTASPRAPLHFTSDPSSPNRSQSFTERRASATSALRPLSGNHFGRARTSSGLLGLDPDVVRQGHRVTAAERAALQCVKRAFMRVEKALVKRALELGRTDGTTAVVAIPMLQARRLLLAHVGDSKAILCRGTKAVPLTMDHKPNRTAERTRIVKAGGSVEFSGCWRVAHQDIPMRLAVARSLGDAWFKHPLALVSPVPDCSAVTLTPQDRFVLVASDGLWDCVKPQEACSMARRVMQSLENAGHSADDAVRAACERLTHMALERGSQDNISVLILALNATPAAPHSDGAGAGSVVPHILTAVSPTAAAAATATAASAAAAITAPAGAREPVPVMVPLSSPVAAPRLLRPAAAPAPPLVAPTAALSPAPTAVASSAAPARVPAGPRPAAGVRQSAMAPLLPATKPRAAFALTSRTLAASRYVGGEAEPASAAVLL